jgi:pimeloyl-ACP methyl ester carboxylesterase
VNKHAVNDEPLRGDETAQVASERRAEVAGIPMRWLEAGEGAPVVLIHGIPTSPALWRRVLPLLPGLRALAWEMVGYGQSWTAGRERDISVRAQADYLLRWLDAIEVEEAVYAGHDLGGGVAQIAAVEASDRCAGLVLSNAIAYDSWPIRQAKAVRAIGRVVERLPSPIFRRQLEFFLRQGHEDRDRAQESFDAHWPGYAHADGAAVFIRQLRSLRTEDTLEIADRLPDLGVPAALCWGAADRFQGIDHGRRLAADLDASLDSIPSGRHFVPEDHPRRFAAAVQRVLG